jgi:hypothetical protein
VMVSSRPYRLRTASQWNSVSRCFSSTEIFATLVADRAGGADGQGLPGWMCGAKGSLNACLKKF